MSIDGNDVNIFVSSVLNGEYYIERLPLHSFPKIYNNLISPSLKGKLSMDYFMDYFINEYKEIIYCGRPYCKDCFPNQM